MLKQELRRRYKELRKNLSMEQAAQNSLQITERLKQLQIWDKSCYHVYLPIVHQTEVDTSGIIYFLREQGKRIVVSKCDFKTIEMRHYLYTGETTLIENHYGVPEPSGGIEVATEEIDVVIVPLLAFDALGNRIGYGKGFYDNFLAGCRSDVIKVGLSFFEADKGWDDVSISDIKLDYCVTPLSVYRL